MGLQDLRPLFQTHSNNPRSEIQVGCRSTTWGSYYIPKGESGHPTGKLVISFHSAMMVVAERDDRILVQEELVGEHAHPAWVLPTFQLRDNDLPGVPQKKFRKKTGHVAQSILPIGRFAMAAHWSDTPIVVATAHGISEDSGIKARQTRTSVHWMSIVDLYEREDDHLRDGLLLASISVYERYRLRKNRGIISLVASNR